MQLPLKRVQWVEFREQPISHPKNVKVELFEIYSQGFKQSEKQEGFNDYFQFDKCLGLPELFSLFSIYGIAESKLV